MFNPGYGPRRGVMPVMGSPFPAMPQRQQSPGPGAPMGTSSTTTGPAPQQPGGMSPFSMLTSGMGAAKMGGLMGGKEVGGATNAGTNALGLSDNFNSLSGFGNFLAGNGAGATSPMGASTMFSPHAGGLDAAYAANPGALAPASVAAEPLAPMGAAELGSTTAATTAATDAGVAAATAAPAMEAGAGAAAAEAAAGAEAAPMLAAMGPWGWAALGGLGIAGAGSLLDWW